MKYDLQVYRRITVRPVTGTLGAEIDGVDLSSPLEPEVVVEIRRAFLIHHVLFFRDQKLDAESLGQFGMKFGSLVKSEYIGANASRAVDSHPFVHRLVREADAPSGSRNSGDRWHTDLSADERPILGFGLYCLEAPEYGGDTIFANLCAAYDALSDSMKAFCESLIVIHSMSGEFSGFSQDGKIIYKGAEKNHVLREDAIAGIRKETEHPLICIHPESEKRFLYITGSYCIRFKGMTEAESRPLIDFLNNHAVRLEFTCRFQWRAGSLALLDNRCTQHYAVQDYAGFRRELLRFSLEGDRPFGPAMPRRNYAVA